MTYIRSRTDYGATSFWATAMYIRVHPGPLGFGGPAAKAPSAGGSFWFAPVDIYIYMFE